MNRKQWYALAIAFFVLMIFFIYLDSIYYCDVFSIEEETLSKADIFCVVNGEIYDPFIWLFGVLWIVFLICTWLQPKNMEDDAPKHLKNIVKLSRLEHEVKELKNKLKKRGEIKS